jgi:hypothetical protein
MKTKGPIMFTLRQSHRRIFTQAVSLLITGCLLWTSGNTAEAVLAAPSLLKHTVLLPQLELTPPATLGRVVDYYNAAPKSPLVILIQDLHAHYGVQKNIAGMLDFFTKKMDSKTAGQIPFALGVEGAEGPIDTSLMALFPDAKLKQSALDFLMKQGELTGMEYFAAMHNQPQLLTGVEDIHYYTLHRDLFRKTLKERNELVGMLTVLQDELTPLRPRMYSPAVAEIQSRLDAFEKGSISLDDYVQWLAQQGRHRQINLGKQFPALAQFAATLEARRLADTDLLRSQSLEFLKQSSHFFSANEKTLLSSLAKQPDTTAYYNYLRDLIYSHQLFMTVPLDLAKYLEYLHTTQTARLDRVLHEAQELAVQIKMQAASRKDERDFIRVEHDLRTLLRVADLQATENEVRDLAPRLNQFVALGHSLVSHSGMGRFDEKKTRQLISSSIDYYVMALMRNKPMVDRTLQLLKTGQPETSSSVAVLVAGGFHTAPITQLLREKNVSYLVITPMVDKLTPADHDLYIKRLNGTLLTPEEILSNTPQTSSWSWLKFWKTHDDSGLATGLFQNRAVQFGFLAFAVVAGAAAAHQSIPQYMPHFQTLLSHLPASLQPLVNSFTEHVSSILTFKAAVGGAAAGAVGIKAAGLGLTGIGSLGIPAELGQKATREEVTGQLTQLHRLLDYYVEGRHDLADSEKTLVQDLLKLIQKAKENNEKRDEGLSATISYVNHLREKVVAFLTSAPSPESAAVREAAPVAAEASVVEPAAPAATADPVVNVMPAALPVPLHEGASQDELIAHYDQLAQILRPLYENESLPQNVRSRLSDLLAEAEGFRTYLRDKQVKPADIKVHWIGRANLLRDYTETLLSQLPAGSLAAAGPSVTANPVEVKANPAPIQAAMPVVATRPKGLLPIRTARSL